MRNPPNPRSSDPSTSRLARFRDQLPEAISARLRPARYRYSAKDVPSPAIIPAGEVRVYIAPANFAGQGYRIARAIEQRPGLNAINMQAVEEDGFGFPLDYAVPSRVVRYSRRWQERQYAVVSGECTHVLIEAGRAMFGSLFGADPGREITSLQGHGLRVGLVAYGSDVRLPSRHRSSDRWSPFREEWDRVEELEQGARRFQQLADETGVPVFVATPDLLLDYPRADWLPIVVAPAAATGEVLTRQRPRVIHAPTNSVLKGSDYIEPIMERLHDEGLVEYRRLGAVSASAMPAEYAGADIVLDQFRLGAYGTTAIEAMAAGRLVLAHIHDQVRVHIRGAYAREVPIVQATPDDLEGTLRRIVGNRNEYRALASQGVEFVDAIHSGSASVGVLADFLDS